MLMPARQRRILVDAPDGATILGAGDADRRTVELALTRAPVLVAADGGAAKAIELGRMPRAVIGDMDSIPDASRNAIPRDILHSISEQETTDFDKCIASIDAPLIIGVGVSGPRLDHGLASLNSLVRNPGRNIVMLSGNDLCFLCPPDIRLRLPIGSPVSLFPMREITGTSTGLKWQIDGLRFAPGAAVGCSNQVTGREVGVGFRQPGMLMILPAAQFETALDALAQTDRW